MKKAEKFHRDMEELRDIPYNSVKEQVVSTVAYVCRDVSDGLNAIQLKMKGTAIPSFTANLIQRYKNPSPYQEDINKWVTTGFYSGEFSALSSAQASQTYHISNYSRCRHSKQTLSVFSTVTNQQMAVDRIIPMLILPVYDAFPRQAEESTGRDITRSRVRTIS